MKKNIFVKYSNKIDKKIKEIRKKYRDKSLIDITCILDDLDMFYLTEEDAQDLSHPLEKIAVYFEKMSGPILLFLDDDYSVYVFSEFKSAEKAILEVLRKIDKEIKEQE